MIDQATFRLFTASHADQLTSGMFAPASPSDAADVSLSCGVRAERLAPHEWDQCHLRNHDGAPTLVTNGSGGANVELWPTRTS